MGWLFSERWSTRKDLIKHLVEGDGIKTLKHCMVGNNLWCVHEYMRRGIPCRFICLYKMAKHGKGYDGWGYKDIDETMGPSEITCPVSYLTMCTAPEGVWAYEWRQRVYERERKLKSIKVGSKIKYFDKIFEVLRRCPGGSLNVTSFDGLQYKLTLEQVRRVEVLA